MHQPPHDAPEPARPDGPAATFKEAFLILRSQGIYLSIGGFAIPLLLLDLYSALRSKGYVTEINDFIKGAGSPGFSGLEGLLTIMSDFLVAWGLGMLLVLVVATSAYYGLIYQTLGGSSGRGGEAFLRGIRKVPAGLLTLLLCLFLVANLRFYFFFLFVVVSLLLMTPVIQINEKTGVFRSIWQSLSLGWARGFPGSRWVVLFQVISIGAAVMALLIGVYSLEDALINIDRVLPMDRRTWFPSLPGQNFGMIWLLATIIKCVLVAFCLGFAAILSQRYYSGIHAFSDTARDDDAGRSGYHP